MNATTQSFLGRYRLVKVLGQGAMGVVYEAVDSRLGRTVAIKTVLRSHLADETTANEYASRFEREAQAAARLSHPHVVTVYDFGEHEDISYIVMEFVRGRELNQAFESGERFPIPESIRIMRELLQALDYAHQQGIVHRDVKPANVMLDHAGRVKLTDFGVARVANANQDRTMPGTLVGTPSYMSPEQILGLAVGSRADIFAAGVILYQFLTGKRPFAGGGPFGVQRKIVQDDPEPPTQANPTLPPAFDLIISKALAKQPEERYESAGAFAADLERVGATLPREVPLIDLDLAVDEPAPAAAPAPARKPSAPPPSVASGPSPAAGTATDPAPDTGDALTLITVVPFGAAPAPVPPAPVPPAPVPPAPVPPAPVPPAPFPPPSEPTLSDLDPEATVLMFKPTAPDPSLASRTAAAPTQPKPPLPKAAGLSMDAVRPPPAAPAAAPSPAYPPVPAPAPAPAGAAPSARAPAPVATPLPPPPAPAPARTAGLAPAVGSAPRAPARVVQASPPPAARPTRPASDWLPMLAGAVVAVLALGIWFVVAKPWSKTRAAAGYDTPASAAAPAASAPDLTPPAPLATQASAPAAEPATPPPAASAGVVQTAPALPSASTAVPASETPRTGPAPTSPAVSTAGNAPESPAASAPRRTDPRAAPAPRKPAPAAELSPALPKPKAESRPNGVEPRCSDLLQRMQLGEPLTTEQTAFFQSRCTR